MSITGEFQKRPVPHSDVHANPEGADLAVGPHKSPNGIEHEKHLGTPPRLKHDIAQAGKT